MHKIIYIVAFVAVSLGVVALFTGNFLLISLGVLCFIIENSLLILSGSIYFSKKAKIKSLIVQGTSLKEALSLKAIKLSEAQERVKSDTEELLALQERVDSQKEEASKELQELENQVAERRIVLKKQLEELDQKIDDTKPKETITPSI